MFGPKRAPMDGVVTDGEAVAFGEGGRTGGGEEENYFEHILSIGCLKHNIIVNGL